MNYLPKALSKFKLAWIKKLSLVLVICLNYSVYAQKHHVGLSLSSGLSGVDFTNSKGESLDYSKTLSNSWAAAYMFKSNAFMAEGRLGFASLKSSYNSSAVNTSVSMDFIRTTILGSYLLLKGPLKIKLGAGISAGNLVGGEQITNGTLTNVKDSKAYNSLDLAGLGEAGLVLEASEMINFQLTYFYRKGLNNLEANSSSTTKTISNGIQASVLFSF